MARSDRHRLLEYHAGAHANDMCGAGYISNEHNNRWMIAYWQFIYEHTHRINTVDDQCFAQMAEKNISMHIMRLLR